MSKWIAKREITFVDATIGEGDTLKGVDVKNLPGPLRKAYRRREERLAATEPGEQMIAVEFKGGVRWLTAPRDVRLAGAPSRPGLLPRRRRVSPGTMEK